MLQMLEKGGGIMDKKERYRMILDIDDGDISVNTGDWDVYDIILLLSIISAIIGYILIWVII